MTSTSSSSDNKALKEQSSSALQVVLQWLTYVFWFWTVIIVSTVLSGSLAHFIIDSNGDTNWIIYTLSPLIVLLPVSIICDHYYSKVEPAKKHGFSAVVMVINAVVAGLGAVGSLIVGAITVTSMLLETGSADGKVVTLVSTLVVAIMSTLFFLRIIHVPRLERLRERYPIIMMVIIFATILLAIAGPLREGMKRRTDSMIERNYYTLRNDIDAFARKERRLPETIQVVELSEESEEAWKTGRITYRRISEQTIPELSSTSTTFDTSTNNLTFELCVNWDFEKSNDYYSSSDESYYGGGHEKGKQCYKETSYIY